MGYEEIVSLDADVTISLGGQNKKTGKSNPTEVEGYYLGSRKVASKKSRDGFALIHFFQTPEGNIGVWGKTDLDRKLASVTPGTMTLASFNGMQAVPGKNDMYKYKVAVDHDNTIEVATLSAGASTAGEDDSVDDDSADEDAQQALELAAAERQARVQALLNKKTNSASKK